MLQATFLALALASVCIAVPSPDVYTYVAYTGPEVPVGDWVDQTLNGNGKGFPRLHEHPAVQPNSSTPTNNINVISMSYLPTGMNIHFQTPYGIGGAPVVQYGTSSSSLSKTATGDTNTYGRTPSCAATGAITQCSEYFHNVQLTGLQSDTEYYYKIPGGNGTTPSQVLSFRTAKSAGDSGEFTVLVVHDMGYTNAAGTHASLMKHMNEDSAAFVLHGGDISYADDWYSGILPCTLTGEDSWPVCYNGTNTSLPGSGSIPEIYQVPLPSGEIPNQGGPQGGDMNVIYESNWDLWQLWMNNISMKIPYQTAPGNHEAACAEFDGPNNELTAYLNNNQTNSTAENSTLTYFSCPPSQRNFTAYQHRFQMSGNESGGVGNFFYSFDYGLAHFISFSAETDYPNSPESPFVADLSGSETLPMANGNWLLTLGKANRSETYITDAGPFGKINGSYKTNEAYEQWQWMKKDLAAVNRTKTPWVIANSHRPMYSSQVSKYQQHMRSAWENLFLENGVDIVMAGHIHWYERIFPMNNGTIVQSSVVDNNTYYANGDGKSMIHLVNGQGGNVESHSELDGDARLNLTAVLNAQTFGHSTLTIHNSSAATWRFILGDDGSIGDELTILKNAANSSSA